MFHLCCIFLWKLNLEGINCAPQDCFHFLVAVPQLFPFLGKNKAPGDAELEVRLAGMELWDRARHHTRSWNGLFPPNNNLTIPSRASHNGGSVCAEPDVSGLG